jgi:hypothetical protein
MPSAPRRGLGAGAPALALALALAVTAGQTVAGAATTAPTRWKFYDTSFILRLRAAAVEPEIDAPEPILPGIGYSEVNLVKDVHRAQGICETRGIGAHVADLFAPGGQAEGTPVDNGRGFDNPTEARDAQPVPPHERNLYRRTPQIRTVTDGEAVLDIPAQGDGVRWQAVCESDVAGRAAGETADSELVQAAGSATTGRVDKSTGRYVGVSRAFVAGLHTTGGTLDLISSVVRVEAVPMRQPTVSYRIATTDGTLAQGTDVPAGELAAQFNEAMRGAAEALQGIGPLGLSLMGPTVSSSQDGARVLNAPYLELTAGLEARRGTLGQNSHLRLVNVDFDGAFYN